MQNVSKKFYIYRFIQLHIKFIYVIFFASEIYSLHINCGGKEVTINNTKYDADRETAAAFSGNRNWAYSRTGHFMDDHQESDIYVLSNTSNLYNISIFDAKLYTQARRSAISLTYYGLCLMNGYYNVKLHFAEIVLTHVCPFVTGKRVFDVYVQVK